METVKLGLCGLGTVGRGVVDVLRRNKALIEGRAGCSVELIHIGSRREQPDVDTGDSRVSADIFEVARDPEVDIVLELIGGTDTARDLVMECIAQGKSVVTANKALIAEYGNELFAAAEAAGVSVAFEAAVAGGIPIIKALREGLAGNDITGVAGIINGTGNFILTEMRDKGRDFADVLAEAQALGYAEADPTFDVEGIDAAHKLVILASIAFAMPLEFEGVYCEGISAIATEDVEYAEQLGYRIKHLGIARVSSRGVEMRVHPTLIPAKQLLANVDGVENAVLVEGDAVGPTLYCGAGAGAEPTASAVLADVVDLVRAVSRGQSCSVAHLGTRSEAIAARALLPMAEVETSYYLRLKADDRPGVMSSVSTILGESGISIEGLIQNPPVPGDTQVDVVILTNQVQESSLDTALLKLRALQSLDADITRIRVEALET